MAGVIEVWISPSRSAHPFISKPLITNHPPPLAAGRQYVAARKNRARCSLVLEVLVHRRRQRRRNDDDKDGGLRRQTNGDGDGGDHRMQEEGGASRRNTSLGVGHVVGGEDDLHSLSHARHATCFCLRVHLSSQTPPSTSLLAGMRYVASGQNSVPLVSSPSFTLF